MNKADLVDRMAAAAHITKTQAATCVETMVNGVTGALKKGERVTLVGFGTFVVSPRKARNGRNPQTGKLIRIPAKKSVRFAVGMDLKKAINKK